MFKKIQYTKNPPSQHSLIWDGECGFCKFWKTRWEERAPEVLFKTYQQAAQDFPDFPLKEFKKASRLIETDGAVYSGPDSAYRILWHAGNIDWHKLYTSTSWFTHLSDHAYNHIAKNRHFYFKVTKALFGKDPLNLKFYWLFYIILILLIITFLAL